MYPGIEQFRTLPIVEKLRLVEDLWDDIGQTAEPFPLPPWHRAEAERRAAELDANPSSALSREDLWRLVDHRNG